MSVCTASRILAAHSKCQARRLSDALYSITSKVCILLPANFGGDKMHANF